jgi:hypothetical protein
MPSQFTPIKQHLQVSKLISDYIQKETTASLRPNHTWLTIHRILHRPLSAEAACLLPSEYGSRNSASYLRA